MHCFATVSFLRVATWRNAPTPWGISTRPYPNYITFLIFRKCIILPPCHSSVWRHEDMTPTPSYLCPYLCDLSLPKSNAVATRFKPCVVPLWWPGGRHPRAPCCSHQPSACSRRQCGGAAGLGAAAERGLALMCMKLACVCVCVCVFEFRAYVWQHVHQACLPDKAS